MGWGAYYSSCGSRGCGYHTPQIATPFPTLYIQQAPSNNVLPDALSTVTNADTSSVTPNTTYDIQQKPSNQGEINSQWLYDDIIYCDTVVHVTNIA